MPLQEARVDQDDLLLPEVKQFHVVKLLAQAERPRNKVRKIQIEGQKHSGIQSTDLCVVQEEHEPEEEKWYGTESSSNSQSSDQSPDKRS